MLVRSLLRCFRLYRPHYRQQRTIAREPDAEPDAQDDDGERQNERRTQSAALSAHSEPPLKATESTIVAPGDPAGHKLSVT